MLVLEYNRLDNNTKQSRFKLLKIRGKSKEKGSFFSMNENIVCRSFTIWTRVIGTE